jgi:hypothetical protein
MKTAIHLVIWILRALFARKTEVVDPPKPTVSDNLKAMEVALKNEPVIVREAIDPMSILFVSDWLDEVLERALGSSNISRVEICLSSDHRYLEAHLFTCPSYCRSCSFRWDKMVDESLKDALDHVLQTRTGRHQPPDWKEGMERDHPYGSYWINSRLQNEVRVGVYPTYTKGPGHYVIDLFRNPRSESRDTADVHGSTDCGVCDCYH